MSDCTTIGAIAGADLTSSRYLAVKSDGSDSEKIKIEADDTSVEFLGILQNAPADDGRAKVCISGLCKAKAGGALEPNDYLMVATGGVLVKHTTGKIRVGRYVSLAESGATVDAATNDLILVNIFPDAVAVS